MSVYFCLQKIYPCKLTFMLVFFFFFFFFFLGGGGSVINVNSYIKVFQSSMSLNHA